MPKVLWYACAVVSTRETRSSTGRSRKVSATRRISSRGAPVARPSSRASSAEASTALLILPNFVLILLGLALARGFDYGRDFWEGLEKLVYYVLFPALLFRSLALARNAWLSSE